MYDMTCSRAIFRSFERFFPHLSLLKKSLMFSFFMPLKKIVFSALIVVMSTAVVNIPLVYAETTQEIEEKNDSQRHFLGLIREFTLNTERKMEVIDNNPSIPVAEIEKTIVLEQLPEGQTLLLRPKVGRLVYDDDIYALKKNHTVYFSLVDMIDILNLAIDFDEETQKGQGWFLREDWKISLDFNKGEVISKEQNYKVEPQNMAIEDGIVFIAKEDLEQWLDMEFSADIAQQYLDIRTPYPLPGVAKNYREQRQRGVSRINNVAKLPRKEIEYDWLDINAADVRLGTRRHSTPKQKTSSRHTASVALQGQALKHEAYGVSSYNDRDGLSSVVARLSKHAEDPSLLGPLKARSYVIGDTNVTNIPLIGDARQEVGFRVSNNKLTNTQFETTEINGDALPGWDVELYRNGLLTASETVGDSGQYEFSDVQLFGGDNEFELFFYGPQGEIRNTVINVPVTAEILATQNNMYDVSLSFSDTRTYRKNKSTDVDEGSPHFAARFNKIVGDTLAYVGVRNRDVEGKNKTFLGAGFTKLFKSTIFDGNAGVDEKGSAAVKLTARRNVKKWDMAVSGLVQDDEYSPDGTTNPRTFAVSGSAQRSFIPAHGKRANIFARSEYSAQADGNTQLSGRLGGSYRTGHFNFSNTLLYEANDGRDDRLENNFSVRANAGKTFLRAGVNYDLKPESKVDKYFSQISYYPTPKLSGDLRFDYEPDRHFTEARLNLNYTHDYFRTSPFIEIDSDHEIYAGLNVNFNLVDTPNEVMPKMTSKNIVGRGLVSSFVYHDKNGNMAFDEGDEPLPEVVVESINVRRRAQTNEKGYSLINDLSPTRATDIHVDRETLPDPYMIAGFEGVSVFPSAGEIVELEFPVHLSGEIDGTVSVRKKDGKLKTVKHADILLYPLDSKRKDVIKTEAAFDGFYVASYVPPGRYLMTVSNDTAKRLKAAAPIPRLVHIGYEGDIFYGYNFEMKDRQANVPVEVSYVDFSVASEKAQEDVIYSLRTSEKKTGSQLLGLLGRFARKGAPHNLFTGLQKMEESGDSAEEGRFVTASNTLEEAHYRCRMMVQNAVPCTLDVIVPSAPRQDQEKLIHTASR